MSAFAQRIKILPSFVGWAGGLGLALLATALVLGLILLPPAWEESDALGSELQKLRKSGADAPPERPGTSAQRQVDEFLSTLPRYAEVNDQLALLHSLAGRNGLALRTGEYRTTTGKSGRVGRLQVTVRTEGGYIDLQRFLRELPAVLPAIAVSRITMTRQKTSDASLDATMEFALFYTSLET